jgi:hypothetical protein
MGDSRYFSANYAVVVAFLAVYSLLTNPLLLIALGFLIGGVLGIQRYGTWLERYDLDEWEWYADTEGIVHEPIEISGKVITPQNLYTGLFVIGE